MGTLCVCGHGMASHLVFGAPDSRRCGMAGCDCEAWRPETEEERRAREAAARDAGEDQAERTSGERWRLEVRGMIFEYGSSHETVDANNIRPLCSVPKQRKAMGGVFSGLAAQGYLLHVGWTENDIKGGHLGPLRVWKLVDPPIPLASQEAASC